MQNRTLFFGDNLEILREKFPDKTNSEGYFDLIYLDPPFNSNRDYNVLFKEGTIDSQAQVQVFEDSWHWTEDAQRTFEELIGARPSKTRTNEQISNLMQALEKLIGHNDMMAYLTMMTIRLIELHRVLKKTGSIYLHCDPTASHYLKIVMDSIFGKKNFRNEIVWRRTHAHGGGSLGFSRVHDIVFFYTKTDKLNFNRQHQPYSETYIENFFKYSDQKGKYRLVVAHGAGENKSDYEWKGVKVPRGRHWAYKKEKMEQMEREGKIQYSSTGMPYIKQYLDEKEGTLVTDLWDDIEVIHSQSKERLHYPTQKPEALLERIIKASSNEGDWILDPFCGCGTTVSVAERLNRNWVGIDITTLAINLIKRRLQRQFSDQLMKIWVDGLPKDLTGAKSLFKKDPFEFEYWVLDLVGAMPAQSKTKENMRGADKGIDGVITFVRGIKNSREEYGKIVVQVKGGGVQRNDIATLKGDIEREKADGGLFITLEEPTRPMKEEVVGAGKFKVGLGFAEEEFPKIQIITVKELLTGKKPSIPFSTPKPYYKEAKRAEDDGTKQRRML